MRVRRVGGELVARACSFPAVDQFTGAVVDRISTDFDPADEESAAWTAHELGRLAERAGASLDFMIETAHLPALLPVLLGLGYGVSARLLMGRTQDALADLADLDVDARLSEAGMQLRFATAADVDELVRINSEVFSAFPEYCWFGTDERYLLRLRSELEKAVAGPAIPRVFDRGGEVAGWYTYEPAHDTQWGASGGMGIVFGEEARGKGLLRVAYRDIVTRLEGLGVPAYRGGTSQPAVLHLAERFQRRTIGVHVRGEYVFEPQHFGLSLEPPP